MGEADNDVALMLAVREIAEKHGAALDECLAQLRSARSACS